MTTNSLPGGTSRRAFVSGIGAALAATALPPGLGVEDTAPSRGLAPDARDFLLDRGLTYLQTGSLGPSPRPVIDATMQAWRELERNPVLYGYGAHEQALESVRAKAASFLGCTTGELVLTNCTTEGMNWVAEGLSLAAGDHVLTTDQEHPGGRACWDWAVRRKGVVLDVVPIGPTDHDPAVIVARVAAAITPRTRVLSFSHLLSSTGLRMPVAELSALAKAHGCVVVVDGAQAVGAIDVNVKALGCHVYATSGHKWLLAPKGTGLLYLSADLPAGTIDPVVLQGGRNAYTASTGVCSLPSVHGLGAAIGYVERIGIAAVERHNLALRARLVAGLRTLPRLRLASVESGPMASPLTSYVLPDTVTARALYERLLTRHHVVVKVVPGQWFNGHRISTHLFNTAADVDALLAALSVELG
ncbi:MAG: aminotransferase class V-fold PLP-dependent enzyme [Gemmatimonadaceae bacterium]|nr:aminotransferase class V-fold PLP-dependent enzyme [Gemmatimonadaceae bacterium]